MQYLEEVKSILSLTDNSKDQQIIFIAISTETKVRSYCKIIDKQLSAEKEQHLHNIILEMIVAQVKSLPSDSINAIAQATGVIKSKTVGDITISYDTSSSAISSASTKSVDIDILSDYKTILKPFISKRTLMI